MLLATRWDLPALGPRLGWARAQYSSEPCLCPGFGLHRPWVPRAPRPWPSHGGCGPRSGPLGGPGGVAGKGGAEETVRGTLGLWGRVPLVSPARAAGPILTVPSSPPTCGPACCCAARKGCRAARPPSIPKRLGCRVPLVILVVSEASDAHVCPGDSSLAARFQHFGHVLELALPVARAGCDPVVKHAQQGIDVIPQFGDLLGLPLVEGVSEPGTAAFGDLPRLDMRPQPCRLTSVWA
jgi:hypothetical protein